MKLPLDTSISLSFHCIMERRFYLETKKNWSTPFFEKFAIFQKTLVGGRGEKREWIGFFSEKNGVNFSPKNPSVVLDLAKKSSGCQSFSLTFFCDVKAP